MGVYRRAMHGVFHQVDGEGSCKVGVGGWAMARFSLGWLSGTDAAHVHCTSVGPVVDSHAAQSTSGACRRIVPQTSSSLNSAHRVKIGTRTPPLPSLSLFIAVGAFSRKRRQNAREDNGNFNLLFTGRMRATSPQSAMGFRTHLLSRPLGWHTVLPNKLTFVTVSVQLGRPVRLRSTPAKRPCPPQTVPLKNGRKSPQLLFSYNSSLTQTSTLTTTTNG